MQLKAIYINYTGGRLKRKYDRQVSQPVLNRHLRILARHFKVNVCDIINWTMMI